MTPVPGRSRRIAIGMTRHAAWVLPVVRSAWAEAMRSELDYIGDDRAALRWALGCITASYAARLAAALRACARAVVTPVLAAGTLLFLALALGHASDQTRPSPPAIEEPACDLPDMAADVGAGPRSTLSRDRGEPHQKTSATTGGELMHRSPPGDPSCPQAHQP
jgi:hypothetical protein